MKPEEELFTDFINEHHSDEAINIMLDPLLYIYWRDSPEFTWYKLKYTIDTTFKISVLLNGCVKFINNILGKKDKNVD